jgi:hypothetical protein
VRGGWRWCRGSLINLYRLSPRLAALYMVTSIVWVSATKKFGAMQQNLQRQVRL